MDHMPKLITLERWAQRVYGDDAPSQQTLQRWAREARIKPRPQKHGRTFYVAPDAEYVQPPQANRPRRLIDRIRHVTHATRHA